MYVCICRAVTDREIREAAIDGARSVRDLRNRLGVASGCGRCAAEACAILTDCRSRTDSLEGAAGELLPAPA